MKISNRLDRWILFFWLALAFQPLFAQEYKSIEEINIQQFNNTLSYPLIGGFNNPQLSQADVNFDGHPDLFVFDRSGDKVLVFSGDTVSKRYTFSPSLGKAFPSMENWALLMDFNFDQIPDILTALEGNKARVFKGGNVNGKLKFHLVKDTLSYSGPSGLSPIFINEIDVPGITDVNNDGWLDILTFSPVGGYMYYFKSKGGGNPLEFSLEEKCWGDFYENGITKSVELDSCSTSGILKEGGLHAGSTVLPLDINADDITDVVIGDLSFQNLNLLINGGSLTNAHIINQDTAFPAGSKPVSVKTFPAAFYVDANLDGTKDLVVSPNMPGNSIDVQNCWYYENTGTGHLPDFNFRTNSFLAKESVDVGSGSQPVFFDYNSDGLPDIVIGTASVHEPGQTQDYGRLVLYENIGTPDTPAFKLLDEDYLLISALSLNNISPAFGDLDNDGDMDLLLGNNDGSLHFLENMAGAGQPSIFGNFQPFYNGIDVGSNATPQIYDMNNDGMPDLLVGERNGNLNYFENIGTANSPDFSSYPTNGYFGQVDVRPYLALYGNSNPFIYNIGGQLSLLVGNKNGQIYSYGNISNNLQGAFALTDTHFADIDVGVDAAVSGAFLNSDEELELIIGNSRGGINMFSKDFYSIISALQKKHRTVENISFYPNPATDYLFIKGMGLKGRVTIKIIDITGRICMMKNINLQKVVKVNVSHLSPGFYLVIINQELRQIEGKVVISEKITNQ